MSETYTSLDEKIAEISPDDWQFDSDSGKERLMLILKVHCMNMDLNLYTEKEMEEILNSNDDEDLDKKLAQMKKELEDFLGYCKSVNL